MFNSPRSTVDQKRPFGSHPNKYSYSYEAHHSHHCCTRVRVIDIPRCVGDTTVGLPLLLLVRRDLDRWAIRTAVTTPFSSSGLTHT